MMQPLDKDALEALQITNMKESTSPIYIKDQMAYIDDNLKKEKAKLELKKEDIEKALKFRGDIKIDDYH